MSLGAVCALCLLIGAGTNASAMTGVHGADASAIHGSDRAGPADTQRRALYAEFLRRYGASIEYGSEKHYDGRATVAAHSSSVIPAFARKYGLPCSACHTSWPQLNNFGQVFRDNGYRLMNERDSPIDHAPGYWPIAARITPQFRVDRTTNQPVDAVPGDPTAGYAERAITQTGFDLSGLDLLMIGTLSNNISFGLIPSSDNEGSFHLEAAYVRFNDLLSSNWANLKVGKFELDNLISEKRELLLSGNGGFYQSYHFVPAGALVPSSDPTLPASPRRDGTSFGLGDNQLGAEFSGHSVNSYTRFSVGLFSSTNGEEGLPQGSGIDVAAALSQAFEAGSMGLERIGVFGYRGNRPTTFATLDGQPVPGTWDGNKSFYRAGVAGDLYLGSLELLPLYMRASDDVALATAGAGQPFPMQPVPVGARSPVWNAAFLEAHYFVGHQFVAMGRHEIIRVATQTLPEFPSDLGNVDATAVGFRWNPFMLSRTGLALHGEYSWTSTTGLPPVSELGSGASPNDWTTRVKSSSIFLALDFAF
ncbi:MAG: hypothetical protein ABJA80_07150 [bacterium]